MHNIVIILTLIFIILLLIIVLKPFNNSNKVNEHFIQVSDIATNSPYITYNQLNEKKNTGIIAKCSPTDNFPIGKNDLNIIDPIVNIKIAKPDEPFKDNQFIRDAPVNKAIVNLENKNNKEYMDVSNAVLNFQLPIDSSDKLIYKTINDFTIKELNETELAKVYDQMTTKVDNTLSKDELDRITGKPIIQNSIKDLYKPLYTNYDKDYDLGNLDNVKYIYEGYSLLPFGSMI
jgi:hypothetical protein